MKIYRINNDPSEFYNFREMFKEYNHYLRLINSNVNEFDKAYKEIEILLVERKNDFGIWLFREEGITVGFAIVFWSVDYDMIYISDFYIKPEYRRKHYGTVAAYMLIDNYTLLNGIRWDVLHGNDLGQYFWDNLVAEANHLKIAGIYTIYDGDMEFCRYTLERKKY